jgi:hypothetical protein
VGEEGGSEVGVAHAPLASVGGSGGPSDTVTGGTERRPLALVEVADCQRLGTLPASRCHRCAGGRFGFDLRSTRGTVLPSFGSPTLFPPDRPMTAAKGEQNLVTIDS